MLTALSVRYCKIWCDSENFHTNRHLRLKLCQLAFSLHSLSVTFVTSACFLSLLNCDTELAANSVSLKDLISGCVWLYNFKQPSALHFRRHHLTVCVLLCSWTCSSSFCAITVSTVQLQTVQFVQYLYSKCAVQQDAEQDNHRVFFSAAIEFSKDSYQNASFIRCLSSVCIFKRDNCRTNFYDILRYYVFFLISWLHLIVAKI